MDTQFRACLEPALTSMDLAAMHIRNAHFLRVNNDARWADEAIHLMSNADHFLDEIMKEGNLCDYSITASALKTFPHHANSFA